MTTISNSNSNSNTTKFYLLPSQSSHEFCAHSACANEILLFSCVITLRRIIIIIIIIGCDRAKHRNALNQIQRFRWQIATNRKFKFKFNFSFSVFVFCFGWNFSRRLATLTMHFTPVRTYFSHTDANIIIQKIIFLVWSSKWLISIPLGSPRNSSGWNVFFGTRQKKKMSETKSVTKDYLLLNIKWKI